MPLNWNRTTRNLLYLLVSWAGAVHAQQCSLALSCSLGPGNDGNQATGTGPYSLTATANTFSYVTCLPLQPVTFGQLTNLSADFSSLAGGSGGGAPRLSVRTPLGSVLVYFGNSPNFTDSDAVLNTWSGVNLIGNNDAGRYDTSSLPGGSPFTTYNTTAQSALQLAGAQLVTRLTFILDTFGAFPNRSEVLNSIGATFQGQGGCPAAAAESSGSFQLKYFNTNYGSGQITVSNAGSMSSGGNPADDSSGTICANVYSFDPNEEMQTCCSCPVTPNGLASLNINEDIIAQNLIVNPSSAITVKLLFTSKPGQNNGGVCDPTKAGLQNLARGGLAWGANLRNVTFQGSPPASVSAVTETKFTPAELSNSELSKLTTYCQYIKILGSNVSGICKSCQAGARGAIGR